ncbi:MAG: hypothetical protein J5J00_07865 [Deltaproteobacteria bacterium]|nr:hypothetical protein [Deltaproteobacteria bacterium]
MRRANTELKVPGPVTSETRDFWVAASFSRRLPSLYANKNGAARDVSNALRCLAQLNIIRDSQIPELKDAIWQAVHAKEPQIVATTACGKPPYSSYKSDLTSALHGLLFAAAGRELIELSENMAHNKQNGFNIKLSNEDVLARIEDGINSAMAEAYGTNAGSLRTLPGSYGTGKRR